LGVIMLATGIALWIYSANMDPTVGEAIGDVFDHDYTDKRNAFLYSGIALTIAGGISVAAGFLASMKSR
jgi:hypothetical protein